jgi:hypothetical protein
MEDQRVVPSLYSFIVSVIACLQASAWDSLPEVLGLMERCGTDVDERFFRVLMQKCKSEGLWREAINLLHVIRRSGKASQLFSKMAIHACTAAGEKQKTQTCWKRLLALCPSPLPLSLPFPPSPPHPLPFVCQASGVPRLTS